MWLLLYIYELYGRDFLGDLSEYLSTWNRWIILACHVIGLFKETPLNV
jgi:hypothetical protein